MKRRSFVAASFASAIKTKRKKKSRVCIPQNIEKELAEIINKKGKIVGFQALIPQEGTSRHSHYTRFLHEKERCWTVK